MRKLHRCGLLDKSQSFLSNVASAKRSCAIALFCVLATIACLAQNLPVVESFDGTNGTHPGYLYGTSMSKD